MLRSYCWDQKVGFRCGFVEIYEYLPAGVESFGDDVSILALDKRFRQHDVEVVLLKSAFGAGFDHVPEPGCGY